MWVISQTAWHPAHSWVAIAWHLDIIRTVEVANYHLNLLSSSLVSCSNTAMAAAHVNTTDVSHERAGSD